MLGFWFTRIRAIFLNFFGQWEHWNGLSSLWIIWCSFNAPFPTKHLPHSSHINGRSRVCTERTCILTLFNWEKRLSQYSHGYFNLSESDKWVVRWRFNPFNVVNFLAHNEHICSDAWCARLCASYNGFRINSNLQRLQLN